MNVNNSSAVALTAGSVKSYRASKSVSNKLGRRLRFAAMMGAWLLAMYGICTDSAVATAAGALPVLPLAISLCPKGGEA